MRSTICKETKEAVRTYLLKVAEKEDYESILGLSLQFSLECGYLIPKIGILPAIEHWLKGLPIDIAYSYSEIMDLLSEWLDTPRKKLIEQYAEKCENLYWHMLAWEIYTA